MEKELNDDKAWSSFMCETRRGEWSQRRWLESSKQLETKGTKLYVTEIKTPCAKVYRVENCHQLGVHMLMFSGQPFLNFKVSLMPPKVDDSSVICSNDCWAEGVHRKLTCFSVKTIKERGTLGVKPSNAKSSGYRTRRFSSPGNSS